MCIGKIYETLLKILESLCSVKIYFIYGAPGEVEMGILKSGNQQASLKIDCRGIGRCQCFDFLIAAYCEDLVTGHRQSLRLRPCLVPSPDVSIYEDPVNMLKRRL